MCVVLAGVLAPERAQAQVDEMKNGTARLRTDVGIVYDQLKSRPCPAV